jgi:antitoxin component HigA of HigAB toxin-antitoxin module
MDICPIRTDEDHRAALAEIEACWGAPEGSEAGDKLNVLVALVESYEARRWPIEDEENFDPIDVLHYAIEELGHSQTELAELLDSRSRAPHGNLPVAAPIDQPLRSFRDFVRIVATEFRIDDLDDIDPPDSWRMLL